MVSVYLFYLRLSSNVILVFGLPSCFLKYKKIYLLLFQSRPKPSSCLTCLGRCSSVALQNVSSTLPMYHHHSTTSFAFLAPATFPATVLLLFSQPNSLFLYQSSASDACQRTRCNMVWCPHAGMSIFLSASLNRPYCHFINSFSFSGCFDTGKMSVISTTGQSAPFFLNQDCTSVACLPLNTSIKCSNSSFQCGTTFLKGFHL